jgi:long-chain acyl-CoA synthetase
MNLTRLLSDAAARSASEPALVLPGSELSYRHLEERVRRLAGALRRRGLARGDAALLLLPNSEAFVLCYLAIVRLGAVAVPLNFRARGSELAHALRVSRARALVYQAKLRAALREAAGSLETSALRVAVGGAAEGELAFEELLAEEPALEEIPELPDDHVAAMVFTHAVDGIPRGALLTHRGLETNARDSGHHFLNGERGRILTALPLFHTYGMTVGVLGVLAQRGTALLATRFVPREILELIHDLRPRGFCTVPTLYAGMLGVEGAGRYDLSSVRTWIAGGMALPEPVQRGFEQLSGRELREGYGLTEGSPVCTFNYPPRARKIGSAGLPYRSVEARIVDPEDPEHRALPANAEGELVIRGANVFRGYRDDPEMSAWKLRGGWLHTEDRGRMDPEGYLFLTGLYKPMLLTGGFSVYPAEIRRYLEELPEIEEVLAVDGVPDLAHGQLVRARVRLKRAVEADAAGLTALALRRMSPYKVPRVWEIEPAS